MYLNEHYVVLQSGFELGRNLPATVLDPIKTRGIRIYLEIVNQTQHPIVNPLISAKVYCAAKSKNSAKVKKIVNGNTFYAYDKLRNLEKRLDAFKHSTCHFLEKPIAVIKTDTDQPIKPKIYSNGPAKPCDVTKAMCAVARRNYSAKSDCSHIYATSKLNGAIKGGSDVLVLKYFPNLIEHRDIINLACDGKIEALYFFEPSCESGPFLSQLDHNRLQEYHAFGIEVYWISGLNGCLMVHTMRDGKGYFVLPERLADFHKSMLFAF